MKMRGSGATYLRGSTWWIHYSLRGRLYRESAQTEDEGKAKSFLKRRLREVGADQIGAKPFIGPQQEKVTINEILDDYFNHYRQGGKRGISREITPQMQSHLKPLRAAFGFQLAMALGTRDISAFKAKLKAEKKANATVNRSLQLLSAAYRYAVSTDPPKLARALTIELLDESGNRRKGKFTPEEAELVASSLPPYMADVARFAYQTGTRSNELRSLRWSHLDGDAIVSPGEIVKNRQARSIALTPEVEEILERRKQSKVPGCDLIFHNVGRRIVDYRKCWQSACVVNGLGSFYCRDCRDAEGRYLSALDAKRQCPQCGAKWTGKQSKEPKYIGKIMHDFRRTASYELWKAGSSIEDCMKAVGMKTPSVFKRYGDLFSEPEVRERQRDVQQKRTAWREAERAKTDGDICPEQAASAPVLSTSVQ